MEIKKANSANLSITITPNNFKDFTYSKKSHLEFFRNNNYDIKLFGKEINLAICSLRNYRYLLIFSFIINNIPKKSRILQIGESDLRILDHLKLDYECWKISSIKDVLKDYSTNKEKLKIEKFGSKETNLKFPKDYFDFIFSVSAFEEISYSEIKSSYHNLSFNLNHIAKPGTFSLYNFDLIFADNKARVNNALYFFYKDNFNRNKILNNFLDTKKISNDRGLYYTMCNISDFPHLKYKNEIEDKVIHAISYNLLIQKKYIQIPTATISDSISYLEKNPLFVFHHIIKCGGTSVLYALSKWFHFEYDYLIDLESKNQYMKTRYSICNMVSDTCISSHFAYEGTYVFQRYPELITKPEIIKAFTFIRDPLQFSISFYYYTKSKGRYINIDLIQHLDFQENFLSKFIPCNESNYKEVLDRYFFIGLTEKLQESLDKLSIILNKKKLEVKRENTTIKDDQMELITDEYKAKFKKRNRLDYLVYNYCVEKFNKL